MATRYARGAAQERRLKKLLEKFGFMVIRAAGSHGAYDLWAFDGKYLLLLQLKKRKPPHTRKKSDGFLLWPQERPIRVLATTVYADRGFWLKARECLLCFLNLPCPYHRRKREKSSSASQPAQRSAKQPKSCRRRHRSE